VRRALLGTSALVAASVALIGAAAAQTSTWTGATDNLYGSAGNWSGGAPPPDSNTKAANFATGGANTNVNVAAPVIVQSWSFTGTTSYTIFGSDVTFDGATPGIVNTSSVAQSIANSLGGVAATVLQNGSGTLTLSGANTYAGGTTISAGTVQVTNNDSVGTGIVTLHGGTFQAGADGLDFTNLFAINTVGGIFDTNGNTLTISGDIVDGNGSGGALTKIGAGTLILASSNNSYSGATNVLAGTLRVDSDFALPQTTDVKVNTGATLELSDGVFADINSLADGPSGGGTVKIGTADPSTTLFIGVNGGATTTFSGAITGVGSLSLDGGSLTLTGVSSIGGDLTVCDCATLTITGPGASFTAAGDPFGFAFGTDVLGTLKVLNGATFATNNLLVGGNMTVDGVGSSATIAGFTFIGTGSTAANLTISGGAVVNSQLSAAIENPFEAATVTVTGQGSTWNVANALTVGGAFAGAPGYLTVAAGGVVNVTGGTLIGADPGLGNGPSVVTVTGPGSVLNTDALAIGYASCICGDLAATLTVADGGRISVTGPATIGVLGILNLGIGGLGGTFDAPAITNDGQIVANFTDTVTLAADVSGVGLLTKSGAGTLFLTGASTYAGGTTVNAGALVIGNGGTSGSITGNVTTSAGGTFGVNRSDIYALPNLVTGAGNFAQLGPGTTVLGLDGMNYTGTTTITAGVLQVGQGGSEGSIGSGEIINNATLAINKGNDFTLANNISGTGSFDQLGAGITLLTGTSTYAGATNVNAGILRAGAANTFSPNSTHNVLSGATLDLSSLNQTIGALSGAGPVTLGSAILTTGANNATTTYSGGIVGTGGLTKTGTGTFTLSGTSSYTGPTTVAAGTLAVNGSIASSAVTVNGGTLGGTGTVGSTTVNAGGALSPGNSVGTINISGNLTFVGAGIYIVEVSPGAADGTNASGAATLSGTLQAVGTGGVYTLGTRYTVLNATGGVSGTFDKLAISGNFGVTKPRVDYDGNNVYLVLDPNSVASVLVNPTTDQRSLAGAIDAAVAGGSTAAPFAALFALPVAQVPAALDQLTGEVHASAASVLVDESLYMRSAVLGRLRQASYGGDGSMASLALGGPQTSFQDEAFASLLAYGKSPVVKAPMKAPAPTSDVVFWAQGLGAWGRFDGDGNATSVRRDLAGFFTGVDTRVGANGRAGVAAGYTGSKNVLSARGSANVDTGHVAAYGGWRFGALNLRAGGGYAFHTIDTDRTINFAGFFDRTFAHYQGGTGQVFGEAGYGFNFANVAVEPFAGGAWVRLATDATAERGGLAALNVAGTTFEVGYSTLGIRAASVVPLADRMVLVPRVSLAWQHAFGRVTPDATLAFQVAPVPFAITGVPIARDALLTEAGLDLAIGAHATLGVSYTGQLARNVHDHAAKGKFSWKF
jgi:outer membrane autotransporter protein